MTLGEVKGFIRMLGGASNQNKRKSKMSANRIARRVVRTSKAPANKNFTSRITNKYALDRKEESIDAILGHQSEQRFECDEKRKSQWF